MPFPLIPVLSTLGSIVVGRARAKAQAKAASSAAAPFVAGAAGAGGAAYAANRFTDGPEIFEGAPDNPGDVYGATRLKWDPAVNNWVPYTPRRRRRHAMTKADMQAFSFLRSQGVAADKAAGLVISGGFR